MALDVEIVPRRALRPPEYGAPVCFTPWRIAAIKYNGGDVSVGRLYPEHYMSQDLFCKWRAKEYSRCKDGCVTIVVRPLSLSLLSEDNYSGKI